MAVNPIPPQAYTKDTLLKAYAWLMNQSQSIKEMATTPDILVSLFLKAQRNGEESLDRPSIQNFKNELKSLAGLMGELDDRKVSSVSANANFAGASSAGVAVSAGFGASSVSNSGMGANTSGASFGLLNQNAPSVIVSSHPGSNDTKTASSTTATMTSGTITKVSQTTTTVEANSTYGLVDSKTMEMLEEVRVAFNLSSEQEALRMLVSLGYNKAKALF